MIYIDQIRAARGLLGWNQSDLAERAEVALSTIKRMETGVGLVRGNSRTVWQIVRALEDAGVVFIDENGGGPGVRFRDRKDRT